MLLCILCQGEQAAGQGVREPAQKAERTQRWQDGCLALQEEEGLDATLDSGYMFYTACCVDV